RPAPKRDLDNACVRVIRDRVDVKPPVVYSIDCKNESLRLPYRRGHWVSPTRGLEAGRTLDRSWMVVRRFKAGVRLDHRRDRAFGFAASSPLIVAVRRKGNLPAPCIPSCRVQARDHAHALDRLVMEPNCNAEQPNKIKYVQFRDSQLLKLVDASRCDHIAH